MKDYLGDGFEAQTYSDSQNLFTSVAPRSIRPARGNRQVQRQRDVQDGRLPAPVETAGDTCCISDHTDIGIGLNAASPDQEAAKKFLSWVASSEFGAIEANALPASIRSPTSR